MIALMLERLAAWITGVISAGGYPGIIVLMALESACIPLPSEVIMPFSGYLVTTGRFGLHAAALCGAFGCAAGSAVAYWVGAAKGRPFLDRYGRYVLIRRRDLDAADRFFRRWGLWAVFASRLLPVVRTFISLPAGISRMPFVPFILLSFIGSVPWCYALVWVGRALGENWSRLGAYFHGADAVIGAALAAGAGLWLWQHLRPENDARGA